MYTASTPYESDGRQFTATIVAGTTSIGTQYVSSFSISESLSANNSITMGTVNSSKLELELVQLTPELVSKLYKGVKLKVSLKVTDTTTSPTTNRTDVLGYYYIDEIELGEYHIDNLKTARITAYDGFSLTENPFTYSGSQNPTIRSLIGVIATACNISYKSTDWSNSITVSEYPEDVTYRTMIGYLAGLQGTVAYFTRDDELGAKWYSSTAKTITRDEQYADALEIGKSRDSDNSTVITIKYLESGTSDGTVVYPSDGVVGQSISFENPLITDVSPLQTIYNAKVKNGSTYLINFTPMTVKWRGNATIECGEIVTVKDRNDNNLTCYIMEREMTYDGGFSESYKCYGENEKTVSFTTNPVMQRLNRTMSVMEQEIAAATEAITDATAMQDGVFSFIPNATNTANVGWNIKSSTTNKVITANINGIGFSPDGGATYNTAIYVDSSGNGHIVGSYITASSISADKLTFSPITTTNLQSSVDGLTIQGSTITSITAIPGYTDLMTTVDSKATPEEAEAAGTTAATEQIASFTAGHNLTYIGSDGIYTGTITAQQINVGWGGANYAASGYASGDTDYLTWTTDSSNDYMPKVARTTATASGEKALAGKPFYAMAGAIIKASGYAHTGVTSGSNTKYCGIAIQYSSTPTGSFTQKSYASTYNTDANNYELNTSFVAEQNGYYRVYVYFSNMPVEAYIKNLQITQSVKGEMVVNGIIRSTDKNTYFDLDNSLIRSYDGAGLASILYGGGLIQQRGSNGYFYDMAYLRPVHSGGDYFQALAYKPDYCSAITLGYDFYDSAAQQTRYSRIAEIRQGAATSGRGGQITAVSDRFCSLVNRRDYYSNSSVTSFYSKCGVGEAQPTTPSSARKSVSIALEDGNNSTIARLDVVESWSTNGGIAMRGQGASGQSGWLEMGTDLWYGGSKVMTSGNLSDYMSNRVGHIKIDVGGTTYTAYWV